LPAVVGDVPITHRKHYPIKPNWKKATATPRPRLVAVSLGGGPGRRRPATATRAAATSYDVEAIARDRGRALLAIQQRGKDGARGIA